MKIKSLFAIAVSITILCSAPDQSWAQLFGDEEKKWERVLMEMKKINSRLVSLKTKDVENLQATHGKLQATQGELLSQIQQLQNLLPNIQGVVEQGNSEMARQITDVNSKLADLEAYLREELQQQSRNQTETVEKLRTELSAKIDTMRGEMSSRVDTMRSELTSQVGFLRSEVGSQLDGIGNTIGSRIDSMGKEMTSQVEAIGQAMSLQVNTMRVDVNSQIEAMGKETGAHIDAMSRDMGGQVTTMRAETGVRLSQLKDAMALDVEKINQILAIDMEKINQNMAVDIEKISQNMAADRDKINQNVNAGLEKINQNIASNMAKIDQNNKESFQALAAKNTDSFVGVESLLITQNKLIGSQDKKIGEAIALLSELAKLDEKKGRQLSIRQETVLKAHREAVFAKFAEMDAGTQTMIDILSKGLEENLAVGAGMKGLNASLKTLNENITINRGAVAKLKSIFDTNLTNLAKAQGDIQTQNAVVIKNGNLLNQNLHVAEVKINKLAETIKTLYAQSVVNAKTVASLQDQVSQITVIMGQTDKKFDTLIETTKLVLTHSGMVEQKLNDIILKVDEAKTGESGLTEEKFVKLIDILKTMAAKQDNVIQGVIAHEVSMTQVLNVHESNVKQALNVYGGNIEEALKIYSQSLTEYEGNLIQAWNVHDKNTSLGQADQAILVESFKTAQEEIQKFLAELNRNTAGLDGKLTDIKSNTAALNKSNAELNRKTAEIAKKTAEIAKKTGANGARQEEIKNTIVDLRKKANVNISRNDDILKSLKKIQLQ